MLQPTESSTELLKVEAIKVYEEASNRFGVEDNKVKVGKK